ARDLGGPRGRRVGLDEDRQARQAVAVDDLWHRLRAPGEGPLELRHLVEARRGLGHRPAGVRALRLVARAGVADPAAHAGLEDRLQIAARRARTDLEIGERVLLDHLLLVAQGLRPQHEAGRGLGAETL